MKSAVDFAKKNGETKYLEETKNKFDEYLCDKIKVWVQDNLKNIKKEIVKKITDNEDDAVWISGIYTVKNATFENKTLGFALRDCGVEIHDAGVNMYWNGNLKLSFEPKTVCYNKNKFSSKEYCVDVTISNPVKQFIGEFKNECDKNGIFITVNLNMFDKYGKKTNVKFENLDCKYTFTSEYEWFTEFIVLNLCYTVKASNLF